MKHLRKPFMLGGLLALSTAGLVYVSAQVFLIPTEQATHDAYLHTLVLGQDGKSQTLSLEATTQDRLIIPEKLIAGEAENNQIAESASYAVIGGGDWNSIGDAAENAIIGAGNTNSVAAKNATIGAGLGNSIGEGATSSVIA